MSTHPNENEDSDQESITNEIVMDDEFEIELQLGDIIKIINPKNERLNDQIFYIQYIDKTKMFLLNSDSGSINKLRISPEGIIGDGNITELIILSRSDSPSYAIQNDLTPNKWINIHFGGEHPVIITAEITNLENDMIELRTIDNNTLYINFDYKGIPEDLLIETIEIREKPSTSKRKEEEEEEKEYDDESISEPEDIEKEKDYTVAAKESIHFGVQTNNLKNKLKEVIIRADQVVYGDEELGPITQLVNVETSKKKYSIEEQVSDLLDDLLSTIPTAHRTQLVLNNIHIMLERFKQLREYFSIKDEYGNIEGMLVYTANYKPLVKYFTDFKSNLFWILPVVKNIKKMYDINVYDIEEEKNSDIVNINLEDDLQSIIEILDNYKSSSNPLEQNKYLQLYNELNSYFTPFNSIEDENAKSLLINKYTHCDINVTIDNVFIGIKKMFSSVFSNNQLETRRFVVQKYTTPLTKLNYIENTKNTKPVNMSSPDDMSILSFITLPEPALRFSKINLPGTNILNKANLNLSFLNYWQLFNKNTSITNIDVENLEQEIEFDESNFVNNIKNYTLNLSENDQRGLTKEQIYKKFLRTIIPKTRVLFNIMKKYIRGKLSIVDVVEYLEPFLIYTEDLTYKQYEDILQFISEKISEYNKNMIERSRLYNRLNVRSTPIIFSSAYSITYILDTKYNDADPRSQNDIKDNILTAYNLVDERMFTNSEILRKLIIADYAKLYTTGISVLSSPLMIPKDFSSLFETEQTKFNRQIQSEESKDACKNMIVAKQYNSIEDMEHDNNERRVIYFDKRFDKTNYSLLDTYEKEMMRMTPEDFIVFLTGELEKTQKLNHEDAEYLAETLILKNKRVINGQYAILYKPYSKEPEHQFYIRKAGNWVLDDSIEKGTNNADPDVLCNLQDKCIAESKQPDNCESVTVNSLSLQNKLLKDILNEFDEKYKLSKEEFERFIKDKFDYLFDKSAIITRIAYTNLLQYGIQKYNLTIAVDDNAHFAPVSPYTKLLNLILGQPDFIKKQHDIIRFVNTYTRPAVLDRVGPLGEPEYECWLYCNKTNIKILPTFRFEMANAFVTNYDGYQDYINLLISKIGELNDDGSWWCDKNTGWSICPIDFDTEEGYDEGYKIVTRAILEDDAGAKLVTNITTDSTTVVKYNTPETKLISNIINAISVAMGINIETQKQFIVNQVVASIQTKLRTESEYKALVKEQTQKGKKMASYTDYFNTALMYYTLGMFFIATQTVIPSIKTRKTHPGCVRSFTGFIFGDESDDSSIKYLVCVVYDIRSSTSPWNVLKKKEFIETHIKSAIKDLLEYEEVKQKINEKTDYLLFNNVEKIPEEHDISNWTQFLPPLFPYKIKRVENISTEFKKQLLKDLRSNSKQQREKILVLGSKVIHFSLAIQEKIQNIVKTKGAILKNSNNEPNIENACCQTSQNQTTIQYFIENDKDIEKINEMVNGLTNILDDIVSYTKAYLLCSEVNTKNIYPQISNEFSEKTIYLAFIQYCKFNSLIPLSENLHSICSDKPAHNFFNSNDTVDDMIRKLKDDGRNYTTDTFLRLMQIVGRNNILDYNFDEPLVSSTTTLTHIVDNIQKEKDDIVAPELLELIRFAIDTFDIATPEKSQEVKNLNNFLSIEIKKMKEEISDFITQNKGTETKKTIKKMESIIKNLAEWYIDQKEPTNNQISSDSMYTIIQFYKNFINNLVTVFPNIILNNVNYNNTTIPKYMKLSQNHSNKISGFISKYYEKLKAFYGNVKLTKILENIQRTAKNIERLSEQTPCFSTIHYNEHVLYPVFDERTSKMLYEYYLLKVLTEYTNLAEDEQMIVSVEPRQEEQSDIVSLAFVDAMETRAVEPPKRQDFGILRGNKKELKQLVTNLLISFLTIMDDYKDTINFSYDQIKDNIFKLREKEKHKITDRLKSLTDEERNVDTMLKINKLGLWGKGLQKGLTVYDKENYDEEADFRDEMEQAERNIKLKNHNTTNGNIDQYLEDYLEDQQNEEDIEREAYDMSYLDEDFDEGKFDGFGEPEEEYDDYQDHDS